MNYLKCGKEDYCANYYQDNRVVHYIFFCCRVVQGGEHLHYAFIFSEGFNTALPFLEMRFLQNGWSTHISKFGNEILMERQELKC